MLPQDLRNMDDGFSVLFSHRAKGTVRSYIPYPTELPHLRGGLRRSIPRHSVDLNSPRGFVRYRNRTRLPKQSIQLSLSSAGGRLKGLIAIIIIVVIRMKNNDWTNCVSATLLVVVTRSSIRFRGLGSGLIGSLCSSSCSSYYWAALPLSSKSQAAIIPFGYSANEGYFAKDIFRAI